MSKSHNTCIIDKHLQTKCDCLGGAKKEEETTEGQRQTDKQTDRQAGRQADRQRQRQRVTETRTPDNHAPVYSFIQSHVRGVHVCLAVTCHLHFWQNERGSMRVERIPK